MFKTTTGDVFNHKRAIGLFGALALVSALVWHQEVVPSLMNWIVVAPELAAPGNVEFCAYNYATGTYPTNVCGQWETVVTTPTSPTLGSNLLMQAIHMALLPSGKVIMINGGSNRWTYPGKGELWPYKQNPPTQTVLFSNGNPNEYSWANQKRYYDAINNNGLLDPVTLQFVRIGAPPNDRANPANANLFMPSDPFCSGHLHLRDGNLLVNGGTEWYGNGREGGLTGHKSSYIFDWKKAEGANWAGFNWTQYVGRVQGTGPSLNDQYNPWIYAGDMRHGRWYSELISLMDGRLVVFGGHAEFTLTEQGTMFSPDVSFFDYNVFKQNTSNPNAAWKDVALPQTPSDRGQEVVPYAHLYMIPDGRIFLSGGGGSAGPPFLVTIGGTAAAPQVQIAADAERGAAILTYSSSVQDPNNPNRVLDFGGFTGVVPAIPGWIPAAAAAAPSNKYQSQSGETGRGQRRVDVYTMPLDGAAQGAWQIYNNFLGVTWEHDRGNHLAMLLPTKQILITGGGWYQAYGAVKSPLLLTPAYNGAVFTGRYQRRFMAPQRMPRLYHQTAVLLPDGRVIVAGGNAGNALLKFDAPVSIGTKPGGGQPVPNPDRVQRLGIVNQREDLRVTEIVGEAPAEVWTSEIFSPPYKFIDAARQPTITEFVWAEVPAGVTVTEQLSGKAYYLMHTDRDYAITLANLPTTCTPAAGKAAVVMMKLGSTTHAWDSGQRLVNVAFEATGGNEVSFRSPEVQEIKMPPAFYMLFYVDCRGKPTPALMVRMDDSVTRPLA